MRGVFTPRPRICTPPAATDRPAARPLRRRRHAHDGTVAVRTAPRRGAAPRRLPRPPTVCDRDTAATVRRAHEQTLGAGRVVVRPVSTATADFPLYGPAGAALHGAGEVRTAYWMLGCVGRRRWARTAGEGAAAKMAALPPNHSPAFRPDPRLTVPPASPRSRLPPWRGRRGLRGDARLPAARPASPLDRAGGRCREG